MEWTIEWYECISTYIIIITSAASAANFYPIVGVLGVSFVIHNIEK